MADPLDALTPKQRAIIKQLGDLEVSLENGMAGSLPKVFATLSRDVQRVAANLSLDPNDRAKTLRELIGLKRKIGDLVVSNPEYQREVLKLTSEFKTIKNLTDQFIGSTMDEFVPTRKLYDAILQSNIAITKDALLGGGIVDNFGNAIQEVLKANIAGVSDRATLMETLAKFIEGTPQRKAYLENYIKQTTNDSLMVFNREYLQTISEDLGMRHYLYQGTIIGDTRQFCQSRAGKYFTKEEVEKWVSLDWDGKMSGTNSTTIFSYAGGYNCRHKLWPISEEQYNRGKGIVAPKPTPPPVVAPPPSIPPQMTAPPVLPKPPKPPKAPQGFYGDISKLPNDVKGLKRYLNDVVAKNIGFQSFDDIVVARDLPIDMMKEQVGTLDRLASTYKVAANNSLQIRPTLLFRSQSGKNGFYGQVRRFGNPTNGNTRYREINVGHEIDPDRLLRNMSSTNLNQPKSLVDNVNERIVTAVHEFAHVITSSYEYKRNSDKSLNEFWDAMTNLYSDYKKDMPKMYQRIIDTGDKYGFFSKQFDKAVATYRQEYLGDYSTTEVDEFFAEAFANFNLNSRPSKWAMEVKKLVNKYFLK
jgi:hypothetical protein